MLLTIEIALLVAYLACFWLILGWYFDHPKPTKYWRVVMLLSMLGYVLGAAIMATEVLWSVLR